MKKIFSKEIFLSLVFILSSFFLLSPNIKADTINIEITDDMFSKLSNIDALISFLDSECSGISYSDQHLTCNYYVFYHDNSVYQDSYYAINQNIPYPNIFINNNGFARINHESWIFKVSSDFDSLNNRILNTFNNSFVFKFDENGVYLLLYSNFNIPFNSIDNSTYIFTYNEQTYSVVNDGTNYFPTLYDLYQYFNTSPPTPPDNTPILTDFYTLIIDKFSVVVDFFTDNTYLFAIPLIPILILCIYFIKRSLIK